MSTLSRRGFLRGCAGIGVAGALAAASTLTWTELMHALGPIHSTQIQAFWS
ncbi:twin-arginine translocation signal domain-containing protein [Mycobacterium sp. ZZG]